MQQSVALMFSSHKRRPRLPNDCLRQHKRDAHPLCHCFWSAWLHGEGS